MNNYMAKRSIEEIFSENLLGLMSEFGFTRKELAKRLGISYSTISTWVNRKGVPNLYYLNKLCDIFSCAQMDLIGEENDGDPMDKFFNEFRYSPDYRMCDKFLNFQVYNSLTLSQQRIIDNLMADMVKTNNVINSLRQEAE